MAYYKYTPYQTEESEKSISETIRDRVISFRKTKGLTQSELAKLLNMNRSTYAYREKHGSFKSEELIMLAEVLDVSFDDILNVSAPQSMRLNSPKSENPFSISEDSFFTNNEKQLILKLRKLPEEKRKKIFDFIDVFFDSNDNTDNI